uniref:Nuclear pore complex protein Nup85 n=1 Tax=Aceria tosichella TaxID=561515 RepID=A0A6G1S734_9ACAR
MSKSHIFKSTEIFSEPVQLLVKESHAIFSTIPRNETDFSKINVIAISRRYRSIIHECVDNLTRDLTNDHSSQTKTFKELEVIWNLCEILLLDVSQPGTLIIQLKNWITLHLEELSADAKRIIKSLDNGSYRYNEDTDTEIYWDLLIKLVLRGDTKKAIHLISCHPEFRRNDQMQLVANMLDSMPISNQYIVHEFCNKWSSWSAWCKRELDTGQFKNNTHLLNIVRLLSHDKTVYSEFASDCESWYQLMVAYLMYSDPCIRDTDLSDLCRRMISTFKKNNSLSAEKDPESDFFDEIIISAFEYDLLALIANCCAYLEDNWWFVTHFVDLLHCSDQLSLHNIPESDKLRESFLQDYANALFDEELLWPIGVSYLDKCPISGMYFLEIILSRIPLSIDDEVKANKIISIAKRRGLNNIPKSVCQLMARGWLAKTVRLNNESIRLDKHQHKRSSDKGVPQAVNLSNALYWAVRSGDPTIITYISDQYLYYYCKTGTFPDDSVFDSLRRLPLDNERLAFLAKYYEFRQLLHDSDEDLMDAGNLIRALLSSKIYPKFFCHELLEDAKRLLELRPQLVFQPDNTLDLMRSIEEITKENVAEEDVDLRKNLVKNMARALITPVGPDS